MKKPAKKVSKAPKETAKEVSKDEYDFEEVLVKCTNCGKEMKVVAYKGFDKEDYLCPACSTGDLSFDEESSDI